MDSRLPVVGVLALSGTFLTGILTAGSASAAERPSVGTVSPDREQAGAAVRSAVRSAALQPATTPGTGRVRLARAARRAQIHAAARTASAPVQGPRCDSSQVRGEDAGYPGLSVSALYDKLFRPGAAMPYLGSYVPQALRTWYDWDGQGNDLVLLGMYRENHDSYLVGIDPNTNDVVGTVRVARSHLGGMAFLGSWLFTGDNPWPHAGSPTVTRYRTTDLRAAMREAIDSGEAPYLRSDGAREDVHATDFMVTSGDSLYAGNHGKGNGQMYRYRLTENGWLRAVQGPWAVPPRAQGMIVSGDKFIFSSDNGTGRGWLTVVDRDAPARPVSCVWIPAMPEAIDTYNGRLMMAFESGAARRAHDHPANRITHLHTAPMTTLLKLTDPATVAADPTLGGLLRVPEHVLRSVTGGATHSDAMTHYRARLHDVNHKLGELGGTSDSNADQGADDSGDN